jgi:hypothetical protein
MVPSHPILTLRRHVEDFEKLASFYLGRLLNEQAEATEQLLLYNAKDLVTHAVCVGMTGSGKTGLCISLLEEAAIDSIPAIVIDPKGDIGNMLLTFPEMRPEDFRPWIDEHEAARNNMDADSWAAVVAERWRNGIAAWRQTPERISMLRDTTELAIYTPGSAAGLQVSLLRSFAAPGDEERRDSDALRDRILGAVSGLLALIGIQADPVQSREHILLSNILDHAWREGRDLDIGEIIRAVLAPPFATLGVFDVESFFPEKERRSFAMQLNNVLASPAFAAWMEGEALDPQRLLYTAEGKPRIAILSIAHLSDSERMFFVTMLLNEVVSWMRKQTGTSSLRAILYMDEIFGFFPPGAEPPSKRPMLTLLKQARAYGLGCVLATQNPVDLDYKGLGNTGTWFIGRLQTERDKLRVLDGLEGAMSSAGVGFNRRELDTILSGLGKRVFLMNNVHEAAPVLFETRWALSYLRGPLSRDHIERLMAAAKSARRDAAVSATAAPSSPSVVPALEATSQPGADLVPAAPEVYVEYMGVRDSDDDMVYRPCLLTHVQLHYVHTRSGVDMWTERSLIAPVPGSMGSDWDAVVVLDERPSLLSSAPETGMQRLPLPAPAARSNSFTAWEKGLKEWVYRMQSLTLWSCPVVKLISSPHESEGEFRIRVTQAFHEQRDAAMEKLRARYVPRYSRAQQRIQRAQQLVQQQEARQRQQTINTAVDIGSTLIGALFGRRSAASTLVRRTATSAKQVSRSMGGRGVIDKAQDDLAAANADLLALEEQFKGEAADIQAQFSVLPDSESITVRARKSDISLSPLSIAWLPYGVIAGDSIERFREDEIFS